MILLVPEEADGFRLDRFLADALTDRYSREYLKKLIQDGMVVINNKMVTKPAFIVETGQTASLTIPQPAALALQPEDLSLDILFEDQEMLVVNKPSGMLTHPTGKEQTGTLVNAILYHCRDNLSSINGVERPGILHRLDRETSGLLMVAKTDTAHRRLQEQIQSRTAKRGYRAIVQGLLPKPAGTIYAPIGRNPKHRDKMMVTNTGGRYAQTDWTVVETIANRFSVVQLSLQTGRTHQIRVHMAHILHPVFADPLYGTGLEKQLKFDAHGQILQACVLSFVHPTTAQPLAFSIAPDEKFSRAAAFLLEHTR